MDEHVRLRREVNGPPKSGRDGGREDVVGKHATASLCAYTNIHIVIDYGGNFVSNPLVGGSKVVWLVKLSQNSPSTHYIYIMSALTLLRCKADADPLRDSVVAAISVGWRRRAPSWRVLCESVKDFTSQRRYSFVWELNFAIGGQVSLSSHRIGREQERKTTITLYVSAQDLEIYTKQASGRGSRRKYMEPKTIYTKFMCIFRHCWLACLCRFAHIETYTYLPSIYIFGCLSSWCKTKPEHQHRTVKHLNSLKLTTQRTLHTSSLLTSQTKD